MKYGMQLLSTIMKVARVLLLCKIATTAAWVPSSSSTRRWVIPFSCATQQSLMQLALTTKIAPSSTSVQETPDLSPSPLSLRKNNTQLPIDTAAWFLPPLLSTAALFSYDDTRKIFHELIDAASGHTWTAADGGKYNRTRKELVPPSRLILCS